MLALSPIAGAPIAALYVMSAAPPVGGGVADTTLPTFAGPITLSNITTSGAHAAWPAGSDNVGVVGYEISVDTGTPSWVDLGNVLACGISGKTPGTTYTVRLRDYDAAGNRSTPITATLVTSAVGPGPGPDPDPVDPTEPEVPDPHNYAWLQSEVVEWLHRPNLAARIPSFIVMAEARINRILQARGMEHEVTFAFGPGVGAVRLPTGFDTPIAAWLLDGTGRCELSAMVPEQLSGTTQRGRPSHWAISGTYLALDRPVDVARRVTLRYRGLLRLSDAAPNNSVLSKYPDAYLYGTLMEAAMFIRDTVAAQMWAPLFDAAMKEINRNESRARAVAPLRTELAGLLGCR